MKLHERRPAVSAEAYAAVLELGGTQADRALVELARAVDVRNGEADRPHRRARVDREPVTLTGWKRAHAPSPSTLQAPPWFAPGRRLSREASCSISASAVVLDEQASHARDVGAPGLAELLVAALGELRE